MLSRGTALHIAILLMWIAGCTAVNLPPKTKNEPVPPVEIKEENADRMVLSPIESDTEERPLEPVLIADDMASVVEHVERTLAAGDVLSIDVVDEPELSREFTVSSEGVIYYPLLDKVRVEGKSASQLTRELKEGLSAFLVDPVVNVSVSHWKERKVYIFGEKISRSLPLTPDDPLTISRLLIEVGIPAQEVDLSDITLVRRRPSGGKQVIKVDLRDLLEKQDLRQDIALVPNDLVLLKEPPRVYIQGSIARPGSFPFQKSSKMSLLSLISLAKGPRDDADLSNIRIIRRAGENRREIIAASASPEKARTMVFLKPEDIVVVPSMASNYVTIYGEVKRPGTIKMQPGKSMRLSTILAKAGGLTEYASSQIRIFRYSADKSPERFSVDYDNITSGDGEQDIYIEPRDVVYVDSGIW